MQDSNRFASVVKIEDKIKQALKSACFSIVEAIPTD